MYTEAMKKNQIYNGETCPYWLAGRCTRNPCKFLHKITPSAINPHHHHHHQHYSAQTTHMLNAKNVPTMKKKNNGGDEPISTNAPQKKPSQSICKYWMNGNCRHGDQCWNLHAWSHGKGFSPLAKLHQHKKTITGITLPNGTDKLFSCSTDGTVRLWNCHTGQCADMINVGSEVKSLISAGPWVFAGVSNAIKAWNIETNVQHTLNGPKGQVLAMAAGTNTLYGAAEDGAIYVWKNTSEAQSPFEPVVSLIGHTKAVVSLAFGADYKILFSGSMDHSIKVWDLDTLQCTMTLKAHKDIVTSLICWGPYLLSSSLDATIKVWGATDAKTFEVIYTHNEEHGVIAINGTSDSEGKPILFSSRKDNSVFIYEIPSFSERGRLFSKHEVQTVQVAPGGLIFTGDKAGLLKVWKLLANPEPKIVSL